MKNAPGVAGALQPAPTFALVTAGKIKRRKPSRPISSMAFFQFDQSIALLGDGEARRGSAQDLVDKAGDAPRPMPGATSSAHC